MSIPERMCVGCRVMKPKADLIRLVKDPNNGVPVIDINQKILSRGIYVCSDAGCIALAKKKKALNRFFKSAVPEEIYDKMILMTDFSGD